VCVCGFAADLERRNIFVHGVSVPASGAFAVLLHGAGYDGRQQNQVSAASIHPLMEHLSLISPVCVGCVVCRPIPIVQVNADDDDVAGADVELGPLLGIQANSAQAQAQSQGDRKLADARMIVIKNAASDNNEVSIGLKYKESAHRTQSLASSPKPAANSNSNNNNNQPGAGPGAGPGPNNGAPGADGPGSNSAGPRAKRRGTQQQPPTPPPAATIEMRPVSSNSNSNAGDGDGDGSNELSGRHVAVVPTGSGGSIGRENSEIRLDDDLNEEEAVALHPKGQLLEENASMPAGSHRRLAKVADGVASARRKQPPRSERSQSDGGISGTGTATTTPSRDPSTSNNTTEVKASSNISSSSGSSARNIPNNYRGLKSSSSVDEECYYADLQDEREVLIRVIGRSNSSSAGSPQLTGHTPLLTSPKVTSQAALSAHADLSRITNWPITDAGGAANEDTSGVGPASPTKSEVHL
jgi:hypothetical protein